MTRPVPAGRILYVAEDGRMIRSIRFDQSSPEAVHRGIPDTLEPSNWKFLYAATSPTGRLHLKYGRLMPHEAPSLVVDFDPKGRLELMRPGTAEWQIPAGSPPSESRRFGEEKWWRVYSSYWPGFDFGVYNWQTGEQFGLAFDTPFLAWHWTNHIVLPDGWCVAERGGWIVLVDLVRRETLKVTRGRAAMVVLDREER